MNNLRNPNSHRQLNVAGATGWCLFLAALMCAGGAEAFWVPAAPALDDVLFIPDSALEFKAGREASPSRVTHNYDVTRYEIDLTVDDVAKKIAGSTTISALSGGAGVDQVAFDLTSSLTVDSVTRGGVNQVFTHTGGVLSITLAQTLTQGEPFALKITYHGTPGNNGFYFTTRGFYSATEESYSRNWFPCYDDPSDKADGCEVWITARSDWYTVGNGAFVDVTPVGTEQARYHWREDYPIPTYLIAIVSGDYDTSFSQTWNGMPVNYYVYRDQIGAAPTFFENQPAMLDFYAATFGAYPFKNEKYGVASVYGFVWGGMENETITHIGHSYINPSHSGDHLLVHEMAHQWWGDWVTCETWMDLWLNEGMATYCDALYTEHASGTAAFRQQMQSNANAYFTEDARTRFPIYNPQNPWSATVYEKGAWIMHMLRRLLGDDDFFRAWNDYGAAHPYGTAITPELEAAFAEVYGEDLDWYFDQWIYKAGYPEFKYSWNLSNGNRTVTIVIDQTQNLTSLTPLFRCLVDLTFTTAGMQEYTESVWVSERHHTFEFTYPEAITACAFDKNTWLLHKGTNSTGIDLAYFRARPTKEGVKLEWAAAAGEGVGFNVYRKSGDAVDLKGLRKLNAEPIEGRSPYAFRDGGAAAGSEYAYWLEAVDVAGAGTRFGPVKILVPLKPAAFALYPNYPNPATGGTTFAFSLPQAGPASLVVYDLAGRAVWRCEQTFAAGEHDLRADFRLAPGVYTYRLRAAGSEASRRMVVTE